MWYKYFFCQNIFNKYLKITLLQDKPLVKFKSHLYFEEKDRFKENLEQLKPLPGSKITFFKNGENLGEAFSNIYMVKQHLS